MPRRTSTPVALRPGLALTAVVAVVVAAVLVAGIVIVRAADGDAAGAPVAPTSDGTRATPTSPEAASTATASTVIETTASAPTTTGSAVASLRATPAPRVTTASGAAPKAVPRAAAPRGARWTPKPGVEWQWQLNSTPTKADLTKAYDAGARAFDIDGDNATAADVKAVHALGAGVGVVCYIDVGGWEDYRSDAKQFPAKVLGEAIDGWPSEKWIDVRQIAVLKPLMKARISMCARKGFDAVEPDLLDGFENDTGFPITRARQITYNTMIAGLAHAAGMSVAQKGVASLASALQPVFDWTLNEQCGEYDECNALLPYKRAGKAVWIVEYSGFPASCSRSFPVAGAVAMFKILDLTAAPRTPCRSTRG